MIRCVVFLCLAITVAVGQQPQANGPADTKGSSPAVGTGSKELENQLVKNEERLASSEKDNDPDFLRKALADDLIYVAFNGWVFTKDKIVRDVRYIDVDQYKMENFKVRHLGPDSAVLTYDLMTKGAIAGRRLPHQLYAASVWVKKGDHWILALHQETPAHHP